MYCIVIQCNVIYDSMGMRTVYIRKDNEEFFDQLQNKAQTINAILEQLKKKKSGEVTYTEPENYA